MNRNDRDENRRDMRLRGRDDDASQYGDSGAKARAGYQFDQYGNTIGDSYNFGGGYGDMRYQGSETISYGNSRGSRSTEGYSRNYGNMGSYGGAQGFGSSRSGYASQHPDAGFGYDSASGHGRHGYNQEPNRHEGRERQIYGGYRDRNSYDSSSSPYNQDDSRSGAGESYGSSQRFSGDYGQQHEGNTSGGSYMGSGYDRTTHGEYGPLVNYGNSGSDFNRSNAYNSGRSGDYPDNRNYGRHPKHWWHRNENWDRSQEENYGNMAGSLSWGYDRDWTNEDNRHYDPLSGNYRRTINQHNNNPNDSWGEYHTRW